MSVASWCSTCFCVVLFVFRCMGHFVMAPLNLTCLQCIQHSFLNISSIYFVPKLPKIHNFQDKIVHNDPAVTWTINCPVGYMVMTLTDFLSHKCLLWRSTPMVWFMWITLYRTAVLFLS